MFKLNRMACELFSRANWTTIKRVIDKFDLRTICARERFPAVQFLRHALFIFFSCSRPQHLYALFTGGSEFIAFIPVWFHSTVVHTSAEYRTIAALRPAFYCASCFFHRHFTDACSVPPPPPRQDVRKPYTKRGLISKAFQFPAERPNNNEKLRGARTAEAGSE